MTKGGATYCKPIRCSCCGQVKKTTDFSYNGHRRCRAENCLECGLWLTLFRQVFGPARDLRDCAERQRKYAADRRPRSAAAIARRDGFKRLSAAWFGTSAHA